MKTKLIITLTILLLLGSVTTGQPGLQEPSSGNQLSRKEALALLRSIGTVQAERKQATGRFDDLEQILQHRFFRGREHGIALKDSASANLKDYKLSVITSADGAHFKVSLLPESGCGFALFIDENFMIYQGKALGCPESHDQSSRKSGH